jgi:hypothetical protein
MTGVFFVTGDTVIVDAKLVGHRATRTRREEVIAIPTRGALRRAPHG